MKMMTKKFIVAAMLSFATVLTANAGGMLTNTNQNAAFLRNPARDGAIGIDGVYSNPAGVAFLNEGLHISLNWQGAFQKRTVTSENPLFMLGKQNNGSAVKTFEGTATAPFIPSVQAAYNMKKWSFQFGFAVTGGGGKCEFENGLGSFESAVAGISALIGKSNPAVNGYDMNSYLQGKQYYFGFSLGASYKVIDNLSVYGGLRVLYGSASYKAKITDIQVKYGNNYIPFGTLIDKAQLKTFEPYREGVNIQSDQSGVGFAPIFGIDYKIGNFNLAAKYEFRTKMSMKNKSTVKETSLIPAVNKFRDGSSIREDSPAMLSFGAQWTALPCLRVNAGYHHFYDTYSKKYMDEQEKLCGGTNEYLGGVEFDASKKLTVSAGFQVTRIGNTDEFINDMSFSVNSWSLGGGVKWQVHKKIDINAAVFNTFYSDYKQGKPDANGTTNSFTRTNFTFGIGADFKL